MCPWQLLIILIFSFLSSDISTIISVFLYSVSITLLRLHFHPSVCSHLSICLVIGIQLGFAF